MFELSLSQIIGGVIGYLIATAFRYVGRTRFWKRVQTRAEDMLADPAIPITNPVEAVKEALAEAQRSQVRRTAKAVTEPPPMA